MPWPTEDGSHVSDHPLGLARPLASAATTSRHGLALGNESRCAIRCPGEVAGGGNTHRPLALFGEARLLMAASLSLAGLAFAPRTEVDQHGV